MPKPLRLFIPPPYASGPSGPWTLINGYGPEQPPPPTGAVFHNYIRLSTTGTGELLSAATGKLSVRPPQGGRLNPSEEITPPDANDPSPTSINLYLHLSPLIVEEPTFRMAAKPINGITGFAYLNVETASIETALAEQLDKAVIPVGGLSRSLVVKLLVDGTLDVPIDVGHALGRASALASPAGSRLLGFTTLTGDGPIDPSYVYDLMRDLVADGQPDLDAFLILNPKRWPVIDTSLSANDAINLTQSSLYSLPVLQELRASRSFSPVQWRQVGDNQKRLWRNRLLSRVGHAPAGSADPPFEFDDLDWKNIFQLEALVEFYRNFEDPWRPAPFEAGENTPRSPFLADGTTPNPDYITIDFLDPAGTGITSAGNLVTLPGNLDLRRVRRYFNLYTDRMQYYDTVSLDGDTRLITNVDNNAHSVTVDGGPVSSRPLTVWQINLRPNLVIIDSFGGRDGLRGSKAINGPTERKVLELDEVEARLGPPDLSRVNRNFDTIYLPSDTARASRTYRITDVDNAKHSVTVDGKPILDGGSSRWHIPAGISGELPAPTDNLGGNAAIGFDHLDGVLFVVNGGEIIEKFRWSSYTSRIQNQERFLSSLRGNRQYDFMSFRSGNSFRNFSFRVTDVGAAYDGVRENRFYYGTPVAEDSAPAGTNPNGAGGKTEIRLHFTRHDDPAHGSNSAGCVVSMMFDQMRTRLIQIYQEEYQFLNFVRDAEVEKLRGVDHQQSVRLWDVGELIGARWNAKIAGTLWLIRPDERPLG